MVGLADIKSDQQSSLQGSLSGASSSADTLQEAAQLDTHKPLVVVVENTEAADPATLQDLILVFSQVIS